MSVRAVAFLTLHSCPLARLGERDAGGMSVYVLGLARELARRGVRVDIHARAHGGGHADAPPHPNVTVTHLTAAPIPAPKDELHHYTPQFVAELASQLRPDIDMIHSHYWLSALAGLQLSERLNAPHVTTFHTIAAVKERALRGAAEPPERHAGERAIARGVDGIIAWTRPEAEALEALLGAGRERIAIAPIGIDRRRFYPRDRAAVHERTRIPLEEESLLYVGRLDPIKGVDVLLRAMAIITDRPQARLRIVGGDAESAYARGLRSMAEEAGIAGRVTWHGPVPNAELPWQYAAANVVVVPSYSESFGISAAEALACGAPVVASDVAGPASFIRDGESGRLVPPGDAAALAGAITEILEDGGLARRLSAGAIQAAEHLGWPAAAAGVMSLYDRALAARETRAPAAIGASTT